MHFTARTAVRPPGLFLLVGGSPEERRRSPCGCNAGEPPHLKWNPDLISAVSKTPSSPSHFLKFLGIAAGLSAMLCLGACESTEPKKKKIKLPGESDVSNLGWGRAQPGDAQPGLGNFPQTR